MKFDSKTRLELVASFAKTNLLPGNKSRIAAQLSGSYQGTMKSLIDELIASGCLVGNGFDETNNTVYHKDPKRTAEVISQSPTFIYIRDLVDAVGVRIEYPKWLIGK